MTVLPEMYFCQQYYYYVYNTININKQKQRFSIGKTLTFSPDFGSYMFASAVPAATHIVLMGLT